MNAWEQQERRAAPAWGSAESAGSSESCVSEPLVNREAEGTVTPCELMRASQASSEGCNKIIYCILCRQESRKMNTGKAVKH